MKEKKAIIIYAHTNFSVLSGRYIGKSFAIDWVLEPLKDLDMETEKIQLVFPDSLNKVSESFIEGFFKALQPFMDIDDFFDLVDIQGKEYVVNAFRQYAGIE